MTSFENTAAVPPGVSRGPAPGAGGSATPGTLLTRRLPVGATTLDREARTVTAVVATSRPVERSGPAPDGSPESWTEILSIDAAAVDTSRLIGAPVLLGHDQRRDNHVGAVIAARIEAGRLVAELKLSGRADVEPILSDIADGVLRQVSAGYRVVRWRKTAAGFLAERWQPLEVSLLPLAADGECLIRAATLEASMPDTMTEIPEASEAQASTWTAAEALELNRSAAALRVSPAIVDDAFARGLSVVNRRRTGTPVNAYASH